MYRIKLDYIKKDQMMYLSGCRKMMSSTLNGFIFGARIALLPMLLLFLAEKKYQLMGSEIIGKVFFVVALLALVPALTDYLMACLMVSRKMNHFLGGEFVFRDGSMELLGDSENRSFSYPEITELLYNEKAKAFYLMLLSKNKKTETVEKLAFILPKRCFTEGDPAAFGSFIEEKTGLKIKEIK